MWGRKQRARTLLWLLAGPRGHREAGRAGDERVVSGRVNNTGWRVREVGEAVRRGEVRCRGVRLSLGEVRCSGARAVGGVCDSTRGGGRAGTRRRSPMQCTTRFCAALDCRCDGLCGWMIGGWGARQKRMGGREGGMDARRKQGGWQAALANGRAAAVFSGCCRCWLLLLIDVLMRRCVDQSINQSTSQSITNQPMLD